MMSRCKYRSCDNYEAYGGRGISVQKEWIDDFWVFVKYMESLDGYTTSKQMDRIDNNGDYCEGNMKWSTPKENARNRSSCTNIDHPVLGLVTVMDIAEHYNLSWECVKNRVNMGWDASRLGEPVYKAKKYHGKTIKEWANESGLSYEQIYQRINVHNMTNPEQFTKPLTK